MAAMRFEHFGVRGTLSSHITKHDEFIKATFSSEIFFETNNIFAIRGNSWLSHFTLFLPEDCAENRDH